MAATGVCFGKALQLTNVLRDVPKDLRIGRCYLPENELIRLGLTPEALLDPSIGFQARPVLVTLIQQALEYYQEAEAYLLAIPRRCLRLRLAVLWPILIGLSTLAKLVRNKAWLDPAQPSRITRGAVYRTVILSLPAVFSNRVLHRWITYWRQEVEDGL
jgi:farnesyl-diphosphate farnesyltransferase